MNRAIRDERARDGAAQTILVGIFVTATMLFAAFTASYLIRRTANDWVPVRLPPLAWINTAVLAASSLAVARGRRRLTLALGGIFLVGQVLLWRQLAASGAGLTSNPHASFIYTLTAVHGAHLVGGLAALASRVRLGLVAAYWHFVGALWLYLAIMLSAF